MGALIRPDHVRIITKEGELQIHLTLEININLNNDGISSSIGKVSSPKKPDVEPEPDDDAAFIIPDFGGQKIQFGQHVNE